MNKELGAAVRDAREQQELNQTELASLLGIDQPMIARVETGERSLKATELLAMAAIFGDWFEFRSEHIMSEVVADTATRLRQFLGKTKFKPVAYAKRDWLSNVLEGLDHSYVGGNS